ncbi:hypothetical protein ACJJTC_012938 [Scirpophaga incertulas]
MNLPRPLKAHIDRTEKIKWKELHTDKGLNFLEWVHTYVLGVSRGALRQHKETSWWNASVKDLVNSKRDAFKKWQKTNLEKDRLEYKCLKKIAKTAVAQSMARSREEFYSKLEHAENDIVLTSDNAKDLQETLNQWVAQIEDHGLRISRSKTEYLECDYGGTEEVDHHPVKQALKIPDRPRGRGRPPATWWSNMQKEIQCENLCTQTSQNRDLWRKRTRRPDPR